MKANRNDPCPCGSGKKYKKCCWEKNHKKGFDATLIGGPSGKTGNPLTDFFSKHATPPVQGLGKPSITKESDEEEEKEPEND